MLGAHMNILFVIKVKILMLMALSGRIDLIACFMSYKKWVQEEKYPNNAFATKGSHGEGYINYE
jgi:hypothetical protein